MERDHTRGHSSTSRILPLPAAERKPAAVRARFLRPEPGRWFLPRPRLHRLLSLGAMARLTLVTAPAGYGKTSLVSDWVARFAPQAAWISLDARSNTLQPFVVDLLDAMAGACATGAKSVQAMVSSGPYPNPEQVASALADDLASLDQHLVVVLDDFHEVDAPAILTFLDALLQANCPRLHLVICSRQQPPLSIDALGTHGQFLEIDTATVAFTREEVADYLALVLDGTPGDEMIDTWWAHSEGWIALMQLAAINHATATSSESVATMMSRARASIAAFLGTSLIDQLPTDLHTFMLIVAVPNVITPDLAETLTTNRLGTVDAQAMLNDIAQRGLFLSRLDQNGTWYRFHPLFREMLLGELVDVFGQGQVNVMHLAAANWFARNQRIDRAIEHLLIAGDTNGVVDLIASHAQTALLHDRWVELEGWLHLIPASELDTHAELLLARAMVAQVRGMYADIPPLLERAHEILDRQDSDRDPKYTILRAELDLLGVFSVQPGRDDMRQVATLERVFQVLAGSERLSELMAVQMYAISAGSHDPVHAQQAMDHYMTAALEGTTEFDVYRRIWTRAAQVVLSRHSGSIDRYHDLAVSLMSLATASNAGRMVTQAHFFLGATAWERNQIDRAIDHYRAVITNPTSGALFYIIAACGLAKALDLNGNVSESQAVIEMLRERGVITDSQLISAKLRLLSAEIAIRHGEVPAGISMLQQALLTQTNAALRIAEESPVCLTIPLIQSGSPESLARAKDILTKVATSARSHHLPGPQISCDVLLAWVDQLEGQYDDAHARLAQALQRASDQGRVRTVIGLGPSMLPLLEWHSAAGYGTDYCDFLIESLEYEHRVAPGEQGARSAFGTVHPQPESGELEDLTNREIDVLLGLQRRLSNKEIGDELNISHLTVKSHARSIYHKLGVNGRRQAIQRALDTGLITRL